MVINGLRNAFAGKSVFLRINMAQSECWIKKVVGIAKKVIERQRM
jgi:hypothetical protein